MVKLILLPNTLGETSIAAVIPSEVIDVIRGIRLFASENPQKTGLYLKR